MKKERGSIMNKEYFIKAGYVDFGYISPELSSKDTYPDYIKENVSSVVAKVLEHQTDGSVNFVFMSDIHYSSTENHNIRTKRLMNAYEELKEKIGIDKLILAGDFINDGTKEYKTYHYGEFRKYLRNENYFPAIGNHDDNSIWDLCIENTTSVNHLTPKELYEIFFDHLPGSGAKFNEKGSGLYYYYDDPKQRVRYIFIDSNDIPYLVDQNGKLHYTRQHVFAISQEQLDWLLAKALVFEEDGWDVIMVSHTFYRPEDQESPRLKVIDDVINAYRSGTDIHESYCEKEFLIHCHAEFSKYKRGNIIACFAGHHHKDFERYTKTGVPIIFTGNVIMYRYAVPREDGDKSELLFDVVSIDRASRKIYMTRIGAGDDREISY